MNKLILIGNGFDLAHGLPTSYKDFLNDFWKNIHLNYQKEEYKRILFINENYYRSLTYKKEIESYDDFIENLKSYSDVYFDVENFENSDFWYSDKERKVVFVEFKNSFFKLISKKQSIENWVDIENEYYKELKKIVKAERIDNISSTDENFLIKQKKNKAIKLNSEFEQLKLLLKSYLVHNINKSYNFNDSDSPKELMKLLEIFESNNFFHNHLNYKSLISNYAKEFSYQKDRDEILKLSEYLRTNPIGRNITFKTLFLDFNYTSTIPFYQRILNERVADYSINKIHGDLNNPIFGFGDETDSDYQIIENLDDNEYLKNFKSFYYSQNDSYDKLFQYIDSSKYQVQIMGHSCGLSDRVMLNTIFEHENCSSVKIFYFQKEDGSDNYQDLVMNISRHIKDKPSMRRKIVNKELCSPLPQDVRFKEK